MMFVRFKCNDLVSFCYLSRGVDGELDAMRNMLDQYPTGWSPEQHMP